MKQILLLCLICVVFACNSEDANDCFQTTGKTVSKTLTVEKTFDKILVNQNIQLTIKQDSIVSVVVETGENLMNDVSVNVENGELVLTDNNICNLVRDYKPTKIIVTTPNISQIRHSSQFDVVSEETLRQEKLILISEDFNADESFNVGDFRLNVSVTDLQIVSNNIAVFYLSGVVQNLNIGFYAGAGRFEGEQLHAQHIDIYHRGTNDMIVNPLLSLTGEILGTGNVLSVNRPETVNLEALYKGELIFIN